ncbi:conserved membrane hypothetical protein [metagenome]|uniref:Diguanylate cyclase/phosphodiesterase with PAS/PAC sensor(S) n=1 Tax=metagenome TaxID=256318 RepID=A0A2P2BWR0_9ZZZZ
MTPRAGSSESTVDELFRRQVHAAIRVAPRANLANLISIMVLSIYVAPADDRAFRFAWMAATLTAAASSSLFWMRKGSQPPPEETSTARRYFRLLLLEVLVLAALSALFAWRMVPRVDEGRQMVLAATVAGVMGAGAIALSILRGVGITWVIAHAVGLAPSFLLAGTSAYYVLSFQLGLYTVVLVVGVLYLADSFVRRSEAEFAARAQRQTVSLLLDDFEGGARDWLWETDPAGTFTHVSERFSEVAGRPLIQLRSMTLLELLTTLSNDSPAGLRALDELRHVSRAGDSLHDLKFPVNIRGEDRWWSLSGNPITTSNGEILGWRGVGSDITDERRYRTEMVRLATTDALTELANRRQFNEVLHEWCASDDDVGPFELGILDLDNFKSVNDTLGHHIGDLLLVQVAHRLRQTAGSHAFLARLGGDEFGLLVQSNGRDDEREQKFQRYLDELRTPFLVEGNRLEIRASIGVASSSLDHTSPSGLLMSADLALYAAKEEGRNRVQFFEPLMDLRARHRTWLLEDLGRAVEDRQFIYYYQAQHDLQTGSVVAQEALLRWLHPVRGLLAPAEFLVLADESGLIVPIGEAMLREACEEARSWDSSMRMSVNISHVQLSARGFVASVEQTITEFGLRPGQLELEVTESGAISSSANAILHELRDLGCRIALDDFGTGHSSLASLQRLPVDVLKLDREFVAALDGNGHDDHDTAVAVMTAIVEVSRSLGIQTLAQGVERADQLELVRDLGFDLVQGFYVHTPQPSPRAHLRLVR